MLPGFRFVLAAIVLSLSVLVFGLGAAALLRAAHEQFASIPSRRVPPEPVFVQHNEPPTLALLRVEPPVAEKAPDMTAAVAIPETEAPTAQTSDATPAEPEKLAALKSDEPAPAEPLEPEIPAAETAPVSQAAPSETAAPAANEEIKLMAIVETPPPPAQTAASIAAEPAAEVPSLEGNIAMTMIATLSGPAVTIEEQALAKTTSAEPNRSVIRKRAQRARERRRIAARRGALQAPQAQAQQQADPFAQPAVATPAKR
jgi:hypothetical protein